MREEEMIRTKCLLVGVDTGEEEDFDRSMEELGSLAEACQMQVVGTVTQRMEMVNKALYIGTGKVREVKELAQQTEAEMVCFDNALSPSQIRNLGEELELPVMDRTNLILDIFAVRAQTREAKLQVESARLQYMLPRLVGMREALGRQGGASGSMSNKGAGEKKLELDRRKIEHRISELRKELEEVAKERTTQRKRRTASRVPQVALVGYTNAGKSTLLNQLTGAGIPANNRLFDTLDTTSRVLSISDHLDVILSDTVGFISKLPHHLVEAFQATLEELEYADLLLHVIDAADEQRDEHVEVVEKLIAKLAKPGTPVLDVYNKADLVSREDIPVGENVVAISASLGLGMDRLLAAIEKAVGKALHHVLVRLPYSMGGMVETLHNNAQVQNVDYTADGIEIDTIVDDILLGRLRNYVIKEL